jgi:hypothetical protein
MKKKKDMDIKIIRLMEILIISQQTINKET